MRIIDILYIAQHAQTTHKSHWLKKWAYHLTSLISTPCSICHHSRIDHSLKRSATALCSRCADICLEWHLRSVSDLKEREWILSLAHYHGALHPYLMSAKHGQRRHLLLLCSLFNHPLPQSPAPPYLNSSSFEVTLVPIPARRTRLLKAGHSLPYEFARSLQQRTPQVSRILPHGLTRIKTSPSQATLCRKTRLYAQINTLKGSPALLGKHVCLIDDVCTTGATLKEARRACFEAGAKSVEALCLFSA